MTEREVEHQNSEFRVVSAISGGRKASGEVLIVNGESGAARLRYTLGEVVWLTIVLDVNVGNGWTRIKLNKVPKFIVYAFNMITTFGMEVDGIFRKEGNSARLSRQEVQNIYKGECDIPSDFTVIDTCTMVKRFLRDLKPTLLDSADFRIRLMKKACQARLANNYEISHEDMAAMVFDCQPPLSTAHLSTLAFLMRQLSRIAVNSHKHKMSVDNLSLVLVGSVFGDWMSNESKKKTVVGSSSARRCSQDDILAAKKHDMDAHVAAVKLLITNANLIGLPRKYYVTSNGITQHMMRSTSAMPNMRCSTSGYETSSDGDVACSSSIRSGMDSNGQAESVSDQSTSQLQSAESKMVLRRDSEAVHGIVTARKKEDRVNKKKRSASFLPIFRDIKERVSSQLLGRKNKSPSPGRSLNPVSKSSSKHTKSPVEVLEVDDVSTPQSPTERPPGGRQQRLSRNDSKATSTGSTSSGRQSRSQASRRGNTNAMRSRAEGQATTSSSSADKTQKEMDEIRISNIVAGSSLPLRRLSQSDRNSEFRREVSTDVDGTMKSDENVMTAEERRRKMREANRIQRITVVGDENFARPTLPNNNVTLAQGGRSARRHTTPIKSFLRRHRPNTVGAGLPQRRATLLGSTSEEGKENKRDDYTETEDEGDNTVDEVDISKSILEQKLQEHRSRRAGVRKTKRNVSTESMMVLNGSINVESSSSIGVENEEKIDVVRVESIKELPSTPPSSLASTPTNVVRKDLVDKKNLCDMATSPVVFSPVNWKAPSARENGHVWVGAKQVVPSPMEEEPISNLSRQRQSRTRVSYSKANESPLPMPDKDKSPRVSLSPMMRHVTQTNNSPQVVTVSPAPLTRTVSSPRCTTVSPLATHRSPPSFNAPPPPQHKHTPPPPVPMHSPPQLTPCLSTCNVPRAVTAPQRTSPSAYDGHRPPTPPSNPRVSLPFSPRMPSSNSTVSATMSSPRHMLQAQFSLDAGIEARMSKSPLAIGCTSVTMNEIGSSDLFKLPQLPSTRLGNSSLSGPTSPLFRQPHSISTLPSRCRLAETKSFDETKAGSSSNVSYDGKDEDYMFGKYTHIVRSATDDFNLPTRRQSCEMRPSVAIIRQSGLVRSRVHQFQEIEQLSRGNETLASGRASAMSQSSVRSTDTHLSDEANTGRLSTGVDMRASSRTSTDSASSTSSSSATTPSLPVHRF